MVSRVLVLGGTGFVGRNLLEVLRENRMDAASASRAEGTDLRDPIAAAACFERHRPDVIVNCAAHVGSLNYVTHNAADVIVDNTRMILGMYEAAAKVCPSTLIVNPIANCAYPATDSTFEEAHWWDGHLHRSVLAYGSTRRLLWSVAESFQMQHGVRSLHFLVPNMYGPYDSTDPDKAHALNALVCKVAVAQKTGAPGVEVWGRGVAIREWLLARDFARVVVQVLRGLPALTIDEPINIGQKFGLSVRELVDLIQAAAKFEGTITFDPSMPDGAPRKVMDDRKFREHFPDFAFTPIDQGIASTLAYYRSIIGTR